MRSKQARSTSSSLGIPDYSCKHCKRLDKIVRSSFQCDSTCPTYLLIYYTRIITYPKKKRYHRDTRSEDGRRSTPSCTNSATIQRQHWRRRNSTISINRSTTRIFRQTTPITITDTKPRPTTNTTTPEFHNNHNNSSSSSSSRPISRPPLLRKTPTRPTRYPPKEASNG